MRDASPHSFAPQSGLGPILRTREYLTEIVLLIPAFGTLLLTYFGISVTMQETGTTLAQKGQALAFSLAIAVFAWLGWYYLFAILYHLRGMRLAAALTAGIIYVGTLAAIDAPFNMLALAGGSAVQMSMVDTTDAYEGRKDAVFTRTTLTARLIPGIRAQAGRFRELEASEIAHSTYSGSKKARAGKVSAGFGQVAQLLETLADGLENGLKEAKTLQDEASARLGELKAQTFRQGPIRPRVEAATVAADRLDDVLARLRQHDTAASIRATLASFEGIFPAPTAASSDFERRQNEQLGLIAEMAKPVAKVLGAGLDEIEALPAVEPAKVRPLNAHVAIRTYWRALFAEWCAAVFIDVAPAVLIVILIAGWRELGRMQPASDRAAPASSTPHVLSKQGSRR